MKRAADADGYIEFNYEWCSTDPRVSIDELDAIERTRNYMDKILATTDFDPTDFPNSRG